MSGPRRSRGSWRDRQQRDPYVRKASEEGWRSRAVYKLAEIDARERILKPGLVCVDLGAAPGSWSQYAAHKMAGKGRLIALDRLPMDSLPMVDIIRGDFTEDVVLDELTRWLGGARADLVMSDMAPNISGVKAVDQPRSMYLAELAFDLASRNLRAGGDFLCKLFQGEGTDAFVRDARKTFERVRVMKPKASRPGSSEVYLVARNYQL